MVEETLGGIAEEFGDFSAHGSISVSVVAGEGPTARRFNAETIWAFRWRSLLVIGNEQPEIA
jgi:hypothetical protein